MKKSVAKNGREKSRSIPFAILLLLFGSINLSGQELVQAHDFFKIGRGKSSGGANSEKQYAASVNMPWIESYQLRTETRDFDIDKQEYTLRISPSTGRKRKALTALYHHQESKPDFEAAEAECDLVAERYVQWLGLYLIAQETVLLEKLKAILNDRQLVLSRQVGSLDFDWSELIALREDLTDLDLRFSRLTTAQSHINQAVGLSEPDYSFTTFISLENIVPKLSGNLRKGMDPELDYKLASVSHELEFEKAEQKQFLDFAQLKYQGPHTDLLEERFSVGLAFQLPNSGEKKVKIRELEIEEQLLAKRQEGKMAAEEKEYLDDKEAWFTEFASYKFMVDAYAQELAELNQITARLQKREGVSPLPLLSIQERSVRNKLKLLEASARLFQSYLKIMERAGTLCEARNGELLRQ